jgi:hypothetical protein
MEKKRGRPKGKLNRATIKRMQKEEKKAIESSKDITKLDFDERDPIVVKKSISVTPVAPAMASATPQRDARGFFLPGNTIGRTTRNPYKQILEKISEEEFIPVKNSLLERSQKGDLQAIQILFKYVMPNVSEPEPLGIKLKTKTAQELSESMDKVLEYAAIGEISTEGARNYLQCLSAKRDFIQTAFMENKINSLEERMKAVGK